jgi:hypothetical protein
VKTVNLYGAVLLLAILQMASSYAVDPHLRHLELYKVPGMYFYSDRTSRSSEPFNGLSLIVLASATLRPAR